MQVLGKRISWPGQIFRGLLIGALTGVVIAFFSTVILFSTNLNKSYPLLILFIPIGAVATYYLYKTFGPTYRNSTVAAIDDINEYGHKEKNLAHSQVPDEICPKMGLVALIATAITHITGASGGKEGAGVQIGLACASCIEKGEAFINERLKRDHDNRSDYYMMCGAASAFGALFSAPIAGVLFGTQLASPKTTRLDAYLPCTISSFTAVFVSKVCGVHILSIPSFESLTFTFSNSVLAIVFAFFLGLYARLFCYLLHMLKHFFQKHFKREVMKVLAPALCLLVASIITYLIFGTFRYNGLGGDLLYNIIEGNANDIDDLIKLIMVAFTFAAGFAGGEVVPLLIIGAGFGLTFANIFSLTPAPWAVLGAVGMLSGGTNLPLVCFALGLELFGYSEPAILFLVSSIAFISSGKSGIYAHQIKPY